MVSETIELNGHIIDSLTLSNALDIIYQHKAEMDIRACHIGHTQADPSHVEIEVKAATQQQLDVILHALQQIGALVHIKNVAVHEAEMDGVFPENFYCTTNLETFVRVNLNWIKSEPNEMDCSIKIEEINGEPRAVTVPVHRVKKGDKIVVGYDGIRVTPTPRREVSDEFAFMGSEVSSEKPKARIVKAIAERIRQAKAAGEKTLLVGGPAIVHTGAGVYLEQLINEGWIQVLFAGNALATHDIESSLFGTSLGINLSLGSPVSRGHENHLRAINLIRRAGSIKNAVEQGILTKGIMHACVKNNIDFILAGSIRDDGPLPDVITDTTKSQDAMRECLKGVGVALMLATTLHSIATGNLLGVDVTTFCIDSDADTVIKLSDRGSHQAFGLVTDCEYFMKELVDNLCEK